MVLLVFARQGDVAAWLGRIRLELIGAAAVRGAGRAAKGAGAADAPGLDVAQVAPQPFVA